MKWTPLPGFEGRYEVHPTGQVRSLIGPRGKRRVKVLVGRSIKRGYIQLTLTDGRARVMKLLHRAVLEAFVGPCPDGCEASHLDDDPSNNDISNLVWETRSENCRRRGVPKGDRARNKKLDSIDVASIREALEEGEAKRALARAYGVSPTTIRHIAQGKTWT